MYCVSGLWSFPPQYVSVRAASGASRFSVVVTVTPSGTWAIAASSATVCLLIWYVWPFHRPDKGDGKASAPATAAIIAAPRRLAPARVGSHHRGTLGPAAPSAATRHR